MNVRAALAFVLVALLWGIPFALIAIALDDGASPLFIAWFRVAMGAVALAVVAYARGHFAGVRRHLGMIGLIAAFDIALPFALVTVAEQHLSSSLTGILIATTPLFVALLAVALRMETLSVSGWVGLVLGLGGVVAIFGLQLSGDLLGGVLALGASASYACATLLVRRLTAVSPLGISAAGLLVATVLLAPVMLIDPRMPTHASGWVMVVLLGLLCTALGVALFYGLVAQLGATRASLSLYLAPVFAILAGAILLAEPVRVTTVVGFGLILVGSWITHRNLTNRG
ncbi:DMT family transporter [Kibdelosporangium lantanae]